MKDCDSIITFTVFGTVQSKANSRKLVLNKKTRKPMFIKSKSALQFEKDFAVQCPSLKEKIVPKSEDVAVEVKVWYRSWRSDLDCSLIFDGLQSRIIENDRQIKQMHLYHMGVDKEYPRCEVTVARIHG
jgi:hypothetical protein|tara:strand:- start:760 stop:1146 length:387 start_codon:yes stop_codon:yes gene_type:complete